jgi:hypothetical protein
MVKHSLDSATAAPSEYSADRIIYTVLPNFSLGVPVLGRPVLYTILRSFTRDGHTVTPATHSLCALDTRMNVTSPINLN